MSKLLARRIYKSRETQTKEFDQAGVELISTVFENNSWDSIRTVSPQRIKARESMEHVIINFFYFRDEVVRGWSRVQRSTKEKLTATVLLDLTRLSV